MKPMVFAGDSPKWANEGQWDVVLRSLMLGPSPVPGSMAWGPYHVGTGACWAEEGPYLTDMLIRQAILYTVRYVIKIYIMPYRYLPHGRGTESFARRSRCTRRPGIVFLCCLWL